jgi:hypothetical protein
MGSHEDPGAPFYLHDMWGSEKLKAPGATRCPKSAKILFMRVVDLLPCDDHDPHCVDSWLLDLISGPVGRLALVHLAFGSSGWEPPRTVTH